MNKVTCSLGPPSACAYTCTCIYILTYISILKQNKKNHYKNYSKCFLKNRTWTRIGFSFPSCWFGYWDQEKQASTEGIYTPRTLLVLYKVHHTWPNYSPIRYISLSSWTSNFHSFTNLFPREMCRARGLRLMFWLKILVLAPRSR